MAQTSTYKQASHLPRYLTQEAAMNGGMTYTDSLVAEGAFSKLVNVEYDDVKGCLVSRKGLQAVGKEIQISLGNTTEGYVPTYHVLGEFPIVVQTLVLVHTDSGARFQHATSATDEHTTCIICAEPAESKNMYDCASLKVFVKQGDDYKPAVYYALTEDEYGYVNNTDDPQHYIKKNNDAYNSPAITPFQNMLCCLGADTQIERFEIFKLGDRSPELEGPYYSILPAVTAYDVSASEAVSSGYNALKGEDTFNFTNSAGNVWSIQGIIPKDRSGNILLNANEGQDMTFSLVYSYPESESTTDFCFKWEWAASDTVSDNSKWTAMAEPMTCTAGDPVSVIFKPPVSNFIVRVTVSTDGDEPQVKAVGMTTMSCVLGTKTRAKLQTYDLSGAAGMLSWQGRLVLWGVDGASNILFTSDINNISYFPYPNGVHIFDNPIIKVVNYMDNLLVFTAERIYLVALNETGIGFSVTAIQNRLNFNKEDARYIQVVKNMVFFKSDNYFYMIVPKATSLTGELTIAPVYKAMTGFFNNPEAALRDIVNEVYIKPLIELGAYETKLIKTQGLLYNYVDQNTVRNVYGVEIRDPDDPNNIGASARYISVVLNYDTVTRLWSFYTYETNGRPLVAQYPLSTSSAPLMCTYSVYGSEYLQFVKYTDGAYKDSFNLGTRDRVFKNIAFVDTGYHAVSAYADFKKRFREIQFKVFSNVNDVLEFGTAFLLDGLIRKDYKSYRNYIKDGEYICNELTLSSDAFVYNGGAWACTLVDAGPVPYDVTVTDVLHERESDNKSMTAVLDSWRIGLSELKHPAPVVFRFPVSGKGFLPRFKLLGFREMCFELQGLNWVYHLMHGR